MKKKLKSRKLKMACDTSNHVKYSEVDVKRLILNKDTFYYFFTLRRNASTEKIAKIACLKPHLRQNT